MPKAYFISQMEIKAFGWAFGQIDNMREWHGRLVA